MHTTSRMVLIFVVFLLVPEGAALYLLESGKGDALRSLLSIHLAVMLALVVAISRFCGYLLVGREIRELSHFCQKMKNGHYDFAFILPNETEDEPEMVKLKRLLNWMADSLSFKDREQRLQLGRKDEMRSHYRNLSLRDELTHLYNRRYFDEQLRLLVTTARRRGEELGLMLIDVDNFKTVNDTLGHQAGDDLLRGLGSILKCSVRSHEDIPFRFGGDEFGILLPRIAASEGEAIAERIRQRYGAARPDLSSLSIGLAFLRQGARSVEEAEQELVKAADDCVYLAKSRGRNRVVLGFLPKAECHGA